MDHVSKYLPLSLALAFSIKGLASGVSYELCAAIFICSALFYALEHKIQDKKMADLEKKLVKDYVARLEALELSHKDRDHVISDLKTSMSSMRAAAGFKQQSFKS